MSEKQDPSWLSNLTDLVIVLAVIVFIALFSGTPDLWDVLMNRISNGQVAIPERVE